MGHEVRRDEQSPDSEPLGRRVDAEIAPAAIRVSATTRKPEIRLQVVGGRRIDVAAIGHFDAASRDAVASRLDRLVAGGPGCLHVDCSQIASIDRSVAALFARVRDRLESCGGTLELVDAPRELLRLTAETAADAAGDSSTTGATADDDGGCFSLVRT